MGDLEGVGADDRGHHRSPDQEEVEPAELGESVDRQDDVESQVRDHGGGGSHEPEPERHEGEERGEHHRGHGEPSEIERLFGQQEQGDPAEAVDTARQPLLLVERSGAAHHDQPDDVDQDHPTADDQQGCLLDRGVDIDDPCSEHPEAGAEQEPDDKVAGVGGAGDELIAAFDGAVGEGQRHPLQPRRRRAQLVLDRVEGQARSQSRSKSVAPLLGASFPFEPLQLHVGAVDISHGIGDEPVAGHLSMARCISSATRR